MDDSIRYWFKGVENAMSLFDEDEKNIFFGECGKNCVQRGVLTTYRDLFAECNGELDLFFEKMNNFEGVRGEVVEPGRSYCLCFDACVCPLHCGGYVNSPCLCECSKRSIQYVMQTLLPKKRVEVGIVSTVLRGGTECRMSIKIY